MPSVAKKPIMLSSHGASNDLADLLLLIDFCLVNNLSDKAKLPRAQFCKLFTEVINEIV